MQIIVLLANIYIFSLLQSRSTWTNSTLLLKLKLELPLYMIIWVNCLEVGLITSAITKFEYTIEGLLLGYCWSLVDSCLL